MRKALSFLLLLLVSFSYAQRNGAVGGKILDGEMFNEPLPMATVGLKNTDWSTQTNFNGNFEMTDVAPGKYVLEIRFLGYDDITMPVEIKADEKTEIYQSIKANSLPAMPISETTENEVAALPTPAFEQEKIKK
ncbi:MAG: carboxypeptidase-like regulatory domain-containing protein [Maribacter sp.]